MKTTKFTNRGRIIYLLLSVAIIFGISCSKDDGPQPKPSFTIEAVKVNTAPMIPAMGNETKMCIGGNTIYVYSRQSKKFKSYDITNDTWTDLNHNGQLNFSGAGGKMVYLHGLIYYISQFVETFVSRQTRLLKYNYWKPKKSVLQNFLDGESGTATDGDKTIYFAGGRFFPRQIKSYNTSTNTWVKLAETPRDFSFAKALIHDKLMYIIGEYRNNYHGYLAGNIFDTEQLTVKSFTLPDTLQTLNMSINYDTKSFQAYKNHLFYFSNDISLLFIYNTKSQKWHPKGIKMEGDFLDVNVNLFVAENGKFYAAGTKDGNFALYELKVAFPK